MLANPQGSSVSIGGPFETCIIVEDPSGLKVRLELTIEQDNSFTGYAFPTSPQDPYPTSGSIPVAGEVGEELGRPIAVVHDTQPGPGWARGVLIFNADQTAGIGIGWFEQGGTTQRFWGPATACA